MKVALMFLIPLAALFTPAEGQTLPADQKIFVSVLQLIATPERFDGRLISVVGFLSLSRERDLLYTHQEDATHAILSNGLIVESAEEMVRDKKTLDKKYVQIVGVFHAGGKHTIPFAGTITRISKCALWSDPDLPISHRLEEIPGVRSDH